MIRHILLIKFIDSATEEQIRHVKALFMDIPHKVDGVTDVEWGENDSPENLHKGCTHAVLMTFENEAGREQYLPHPEHNKLKLDFVPLIDDITVFDYTL